MKLHKILSNLIKFNLGVDEGQLLVSKKYQFKKLKL